MSKASPPSVQVESASFTYDRSPVLQGASLQVRAGEMLALVGCNGAGKTTLLRLINGSLRPNQGRVTLDGADVCKLPPKERARRIATVPQNPSLPEGATVMEMVLMGRNPHLGFLQWEDAGDLRVAQEALEVTETAGLAPRPLSELSGGERRRAFIARALAQQASLLILDEPTAHLDIGYQVQILQMVLSIRRRRGITIIAAMHELSLAAQFADRIAILNRGKIEAVGPPAEVFSKERIEGVFGAAVSVLQHPAEGSPVIVPNRTDVSDT